MMDKPFLFAPVQTIERAMMLILAPHHMSRKRHSTTYLPLRFIICGQMYKYNKSNHHHLVPNIVQRFHVRQSIIIVVCVRRWGNNPRSSSVDSGRFDNRGQHDRRMDRTGAVVARNVDRAAAADALGVDRLSEQRRTMMMMQWRRWYGHQCRTSTKHHSL